MIIYMIYVRAALPVTACRKLVQVIMCGTFSVLFKEAVEEQKISAADIC